MPQTVANRMGYMRQAGRFANIPEANIQRSVFVRDHGRKTAVDAGYLYPILADEALPGDTFKLRTFAFGRMSTPVNAVMENMYVDFFYFAIPYRLVWDNWEKFNGAQDNPGDSTSFLVPQFEDVVVAEESLSDHMGLPLAGGNPISFNSLHHRAYNLVFNEWFRDENLIDSKVVDKDDGPDSLADYVLLRRGKRHDYFTSCLPFAQKGDAVELSFGGTAPILGTIVGDGSAPAFDGGSGARNLVGQSGTVNALFSGANFGSNETMNWSNPHLDASGLTADLASATGQTINAIRQAFQVQRLLEKDARGGTRYPEILRAHFGVISPDMRLQRPEYLGGGSVRININPVARTAPTAGVGVGDLAAYGTFSAQGNGFTKSFSEHCLILGIMNIRADLSYQQGMPRMFSRQTRYDFYWPSFAHLGEQEVLSKEIYMEGNGSDDSVFGYQERYAEYRYKPSQVTGKMRSDAGTSLDNWHLALDFGVRPVLNETFINDQPPIDRITQVPSEPHFKVDIHFSYRCARPMPTYSVPGLIDHF